MKIELRNVIHETRGREAPSILGSEISKCSHGFGFPLLDHVVADFVAALAEHALALRTVEAAHQLNIMLAGARKNGKVAFMSFELQSLLENTLTLVATTGMKIEDFELDRDGNGVHLDFSFALRVDDEIISNLCLFVNHLF